MNVCKCLKTRALSYAFCFGSLATVGWTEDAVRWPPEARPVIEADFFTESPDGYLEERALLICGDFDLLLSVTKNWKRGTSSDPRFSFVFESVKNPEVSLGVSVFKPGEFLSDLSEDSWAAYLESLKSEKPEVNITFTHHSKVSPEPPIILNSEYRQIDYVEELAGEERRKVREIFAMIRGNLYVFSFMGPESLIDERRRWHNLMLSRMSLLEKS